MSVSQSDPKLLNAFDVVNMIGGKALDRMVSAEYEPESNPSRQFLTAVAPRDILARVQHVLLAMASVPAVDDVKFKVKATVRGCSADTDTPVVVSVFALAESLNVVEMRRCGRGDVRDYQRVCSVIRGCVGEAR